MGYIVNTHRKNGKINVMDYDALLEIPEQECLYCLTQRDVLIILAQLEYVSWATRYLSPSDTPIDREVIEAWRMSIQEKLMSDCGVTDQINNIYNLLVNLNHKCQELEMANCVAQAMALNFYRQDLINQGQPAFPDTTFSSDSTLPDQSQLYASAEGLCSAITRYLASIFADYLEKAGILSSLATTALALVNPILGAIAGTIEAALLADLDAALQDGTAIDDVTCCMYTALRDKEVTFENFATSLADCGFSFPDHNATLAGVIGNANQDYANYLAFVGVLRTETNKGLADAPTSYPVCGSCGCNDTVDFTIGQHGDWEVYMGTFDGAEGLKSVDNTDNVFAAHHTSVRLVRHFNPPCPHINSIDVYYKQSSNAEGRTTTGSNTIYYNLWNLDPTDCPLDFQANTGTGITMTEDNAEHVAHYVLNADDVKCLQMWDHLDVKVYHIRKIVINP